MNKTKIEWCDSTWNPVTGCLHGCEYCYARKIARRFCYDPWNTVENNKNHLVGVPMRNEFYKGDKIDPYPYGFDPTFHKYRLDEPARKIKGQNIFVCSMADLFGEWVPDEWIREVFETCEKAPQHNYLFLTKNPKRYREILPLWKSYLGGLQNMWFGISYTHLIDGIIPGAHEFIKNHNNNLFMSLEPILEPLHLGIVRHYVKWIIVGAETGNRKGKIIPEKLWIDNLVEECRHAEIPVFMKDSLIPITGKENMLREFPEGLRR